MNHFKRWTAMVACALLIASATAFGDGTPRIKRILLVGDSWTHFMSLDNVFRETLDARGFTGYEEFNIAVGGTKASQWADPSKIANLQAYLKSFPTIDIVFMTLGGNDMMYGEPYDWFDSLNMPGGEDAFFDWVAGNVATVVRGASSVRPDLHVVVCGYDYANAIRKTTDSVCALTPQEALDRCNFVNQAMIRCEKRVLQGVRGIERCQFVNNYGVLQHAIGYPGANLPGWLSPWTGECKYDPHWDPTGVDVFRFNPGEVPLPGQLADNYVPFEGGDPTFMKSPWEGLLYFTGQWAGVDYGIGAPIDDWIHLSKEGHLFLVGHCFDVCMQDWLSAPTHPTVVSVERSTPSPVCASQIFDPVNLDQVAFTVTFSEPVTGVDENDFAPVTRGAIEGASIESITAAKDGAVYTVMVNTGTGDGTLGLAVVDNDSIRNTQAAPLWGVGLSMNWAPGLSYQVNRHTAVPVAAWPLAWALMAAGVLAIYRRHRRA